MKFFLTTLVLSCVLAVVQVWAAPAEVKERDVPVATPMVGVSDQDRMARDWMYNNVKQYCSAQASGTVPSALVNAPSTESLSDQEKGMRDWFHSVSKQLCNQLLSATGAPTLARRDEAKPAVILPIPPITPIIPITSLPPAVSPPFPPFPPFPPPPVFPPFPPPPVFPPFPPFPPTLGIGRI